MFSKSIKCHRILQRNSSVKRCLHDAQKYTIEVKLDMEVPLDRIDKYLVSHFRRQEKSNISFGFVRELFRKKEISVNGKRLKDSSYSVNNKDIITIPKFLLLDRLSPLKEKRTITLTEEQEKEIQSWVLYKNDEVIVINKPPGISVQGGSKMKVHLDGMLQYLKFGYPQAPLLVHRLDKDVSGCLILARTPLAARRIQSFFKSNEVPVKKVYWALVSSKPKPSSGRIKMLLKKTDQKVVPVAVYEKGAKMSITEYSVIDTIREVSLLSLIPVTGRTHQLRVHCASALNCEIVGDRKYGIGIPQVLMDEESSVGPYIYLHCREICLPYVDSLKRRVIITAPLFDYFKVLLDRFGFNEKLYPSVAQTQSMVDNEAKKQKRYRKKSTNLSRTPSRLSANTVAKKN